MMIPSRKGPWALLHKAVGYFPEKGGGADGCRTQGESSAAPGVYRRGPRDRDVFCPKSVLTARLPPSG